MNKLLSSLQKTLVDTMVFYDLPINQLLLQYQVKKWSIRQILHHLADAEMVLHYRLKKIVSEDQPMIQNFDQDQWNTQLDYTNSDLTRSKDLFLVMRAENIVLVEKYYISHGTNKFTHSLAGIRNLKMEMDKIALHNQHHINQIETALRINI